MNRTLDFIVRMRKEHAQGLTEYTMLVGAIAVAAMAAFNKYGLDLRHLVRVIIKHL